MKIPIWKCSWKWLCRMAGNLFWSQCVDPFSAEIAVSQANCHDCWYAGSFHRQVISRNYFYYMVYIGHCLPWGRIAIAYVSQMMRNDRKSKHINASRLGLYHCDLVMPKCDLYLGNIRLGDTSCLNWFWFLISALLISDINLRTIAQRVIELLFCIIRLKRMLSKPLTHHIGTSDWETHICVGNLTIVGSDNGLSPRRRQAII